MGILEKIGALFKSKRPFEAGRLVLKGPLPKEGNLLLIFPDEPTKLTLWFPYIRALFQHFVGRKWGWAPTPYLPFVDYLLPDIELVDSLNEWRPEEPLRFIIDLNTTSSYRSILAGLKAEYRFSLDPSLYPYANFIFKIDEGREYITQFKSFLKFLGLKVEDEPLTISEEVRTKTWDYLLYRGHSAGNLLVFIEFEEEKSIPIHDVLVEMLKGKVTFMAPEDVKREKVTYDQDLVYSLLGTLSLSDLYIGDGGFFLGLAYHFRVPILLVDSELELPETCRWSSIGEKTKREELVEVLTKLLRG